MTDGPELRASDEDREQAAREIREHYAAGRLDDDELNERLEATYAARTRGELARVRADLPALPAPPAAQRAELAERRRRLQRQLLQQSGGGLGLFALCAAIWLASGASGAFWPIWILIFPLLTLVSNGWRLYGPAPDLDRVEAELERDRRHRERHAEHRARHAERDARRHDRRRR